MVVSEDDKDGTGDDGELVVKMVMLLMKLLKILGAIVIMMVILIIDSQTIRKLYRTKRLLLK